MNKLKSAFATFAIIFLKELKHAFRDKDVLIYTVVVPAVLYPLLLVGGIELFVMKQEADTKEQINYAVVDSAKPKIKIVEKLLSRSKRYRKIETTNGRADLFSGRISVLLDEVNVPVARTPVARTAAASNAAANTAPANTAPANTAPANTAPANTAPANTAPANTAPANTAPANTAAAGTKAAKDSLQHLLDPTRVEAMVPRNTLDLKVVDDLNSELITGYRTSLSGAFKVKGLGPAAVEISKVEEKNVNPEKKEIFSLGLALLFFSLFNVALGAAYPAIAATSEEFEHNTIESSLMLPVNRWFFMTGKLSAVSVLALLAGSLNLVSMYGDSSLAFMGGGSIKAVDAFRPDFNISLGQIPWLTLAYLAIAFIYASILMMTAAFCRTVRSSQQWITLPLTIFMLLPFFAIVPQVQFTCITALIPVLGNILTLRSLFNGDSLNYLHLISLLQALILVAVSMKIAAVSVFERFEGKWRF